MNWVEALATIDCLTVDVYESSEELILEVKLVDIGANEQEMSKETLT